MIIPPEYAHLSDKEVAGLLRVTKNAVIQARRRTRGVCVYCENPAVAESSYCVTHRDAVRKRQRRRGKFSPWKPGGRGRPPKP